MQINNMTASEVAQVIFDHDKKITLAKGKQYSLQRFACVGPGDVVLVPKKKNGRLYVRCKNGLAQLYPIYQSKTRFGVGLEEVELTFKEIESPEELQGYKSLSDYHYRGTVLHGRHVPIIATLDHPFLPKVIGYVELTTTFIMNKPRSLILDAPFSDGNGISWKDWDLQAMRTKTNLVVRIARCVVYPEVRGLGLGRLLLNHAFRYATKHWQIAGLKPYFIEITADMLKYLPFAERSGMHFVGYTEGNLKRLHRDMSYILKNYNRVEGREILLEESAGIVDLQVSYAAILKHIVENGGPSLRNALRLMQFNGNKVNSTQYRVLHQLLRLPKPTYLKGLTPVSENFIRNRVKQIQVENHTFDVQISIKPISKPIVLSDVTISVVSRVQQTSKSRAVQEAFGIKPEHLNSKIISGLSLEVKPGSTLLIVGPSGSGKTLLLSTIAGKFNEIRRQPGSRIQISGTVDIPPDMQVGSLSEMIENKPIIELYGNRDVRRAIFVLNMAGLSEAHLYLKRFRELSAGQQYRAMLAGMIDAERNAWFADEFCSTLDPVTAHIVAHNLKRLAVKFGSTLIVAAPHWNYFLGALKPDQVVYLMPGGEHRVFRGDEFLKLAQGYSEPRRGRS